MAEAFDPLKHRNERRRIQLLAIIGSQGEFGNSFLLTKEVLKPFNELNYEIVQLAKKELRVEGDASSTSRRKTLLPLCCG